MPDPLDRLTLAQQKIDELFGSNYSRENPQVLIAVVQSAASDWAAPRHRHRHRARRRGPGRARRAATAHRAPASAGAMTTIFTTLSGLGVILFAALLVVMLIEVVDTLSPARPYRWPFEGLPGTGI
jgi:hypothetical protein